MLLQEITMMINSWRCNGLNCIVCHQSVLCSYPSLWVTSPWASIFLVRHLYKPVKNIFGDIRMGLQVTESCYINSTEYHSNAQCKWMIAFSEYKRNGQEAAMF